LAWREPTRKIPSPKLAAIRSRGFLLRPVSLSAVSVAGEFVGSIGWLDLRCVACGFNEMPALCAPVFGRHKANPASGGSITAADPDTGHPAALGANFIARREGKQILLPQGGIRMTCHSERSAA
jgi:hypothetical protein